MARLKAWSVYVTALLLGLLGNGQRVASQDVEDASWERARHLGTREGYVGYLEQHPEGRHALLATDALFKLSWEGWNPDAKGQRELISDESEDFVPVVIYP